ncbi:GntR family transcriptional regulator [Clostridium swellfunianum]|uniref:GntR family transcriptional regulator n=1 Tax=Clostridium swellfunianum TaxID=1367462 RepID=UPI00202FCCEC|nr:GntR family transcriptional regulator [Clostridium swellfunianum]MCM0647331.1 GntR family transcriptional regulator [Clostridium swellfunianum]
MTEDKKSLYSQIVDYLIGMIENKEIQVGDRLPTELELMEKFNVSRITAKRALEELKNKGLIYRKKGHGSFLSKTLEKENNIQQKIISMIIPYENSTGRFIDYIRGAADYLYSKGYLLSINCTDGYEAKERDFLISMSGMGVSGIIYYPTNRINNFDILSALYMNEYPIVLIDKYFDSLPLSYSVSDNFAGGYESCKHLIDLGHRNIAFMSSINIEKVSSVRERFLGYCKALKDNGLKITSDFILTEFLDGIATETAGEVNIDYTPSLLEKLIDKEVTAVIAENDYIALDIIKALEAIQVEMPNDISLIGFDNIPILSQMNIQLTTIEQDFYEIGRKAAVIVVDAIEGKNRKQIKEITPIKLIERNSTSKAAR